MGLQNLDRSQKFNEYERIEPEVSITSDDEDIFGSSEIELSVDEDVFIPTGLDRIFIGDALIEFDNADLTLNPDDLLESETYTEEEKLEASKHHFLNINISTVNDVAEFEANKSAEVTRDLALNSTYLAKLIKQMYNEGVISKDDDINKIRAKLRINDSDGRYNIPQTLDTFGMNEEEIRAVEYFTTQANSAMALISAEANRRTNLSTDVKRNKASAIKESFKDNTDIGDVTSILKECTLVTGIDYNTGRREISFEAKCKCGNTIVNESFGTAYTNGGVILNKFRCTSCNEVYIPSLMQMNQIISNVAAITKKKKELTNMANWSEEISAQHLIDCEGVIFTTKNISTHTSITSQIEQYVQKMDHLDLKVIYSLDKDKLFRDILNSALLTTNSSVGSVIHAIKSSVFNSHMFQEHSRDTSYAYNSITNIVDRIEYCRENDISSLVRMAFVFESPEKFLDFVSSVVGRRVYIKDIFKSKTNFPNFIERVDLTKLRDFAENLRTEVRFTEEEKRTSVDNFIKGIHYMQRSSFNEVELRRVYPFLDELIIKNLERLLYLESSEIITSLFVEKQKLVKAVQKFAMSGEVPKNTIYTNEVIKLTNVINELNSRSSVIKLSEFNEESIKQIPKLLNTAGTHLREISLGHNVECDIKMLGTHPELVDFAGQLIKMVRYNRTLQYVISEIVSSIFLSKNVEMFKVIETILQQATKTIEAEATEYINVAKRTSLVDELTDIFTFETAPIAPLVYGAICGSAVFNKQNGDTEEVSTLKEFIEVTLSSNVEELSNNLSLTYDFSYGRARDILEVMIPDLNSKPKLKEMNGKYFYGRVEIDSYSVCLRLYDDTGDEALGELLKVNPWG